MNKMTNLEEQIRAQRDLLDVERPREGHEARFLQKLEDRPVRRFNIRHGLQMAASIAVILASAFVLVQVNKKGAGKNKPMVSEAVSEANLYYAAQVDLRYEQIQAFDFENGEEKDILLKELQELDRYQRQVLEDLEAHPDDARVIHALVRHYQIKLEVMDQIISHLNQLQSLNTESDEKTSM